MTIKKVAAFHEAGHAIAAYRSLFHSLEETIDLGGYGAGATSVSLSRSKLQDAGKPVVEAVLKDHDVTKDLVLVLCAGLVAEKLAAKGDPSIVPMPECSRFDHRLAKDSLAAAGLPCKPFAAYPAAAEEVLTKNWALVEALAEFLFERRSVTAKEVLKFIEAHDSASA